MKLKFHVEGMSCSACSASVERVTKRIEGVENAEVSLLAKQLTVTASADTPELRDKIREAIEKAGFSASPETEGLSSDGKPTKDDVPSVSEENTSVLQKKPSAADKTQSAMKVRLMSSCILLVLLMYLSMGHMIGLPLPSFLYGDENFIAFAFTQFLIALPICYLNRKFYKVGFRALRNRSPNMDSLVAVGSTAALLYGIFAIYRIGYGYGHGDMTLVLQYGRNLYFESAAMILTLVSVGKYLEERSKNRTGEAVEKLKKLAPDTAFVESDGVIREVKTSSITVGDIVVIRPGQSLPVDGIVIEGCSAVDESSLTGESMPVEKQVGSQVFSASINKTGILKYRAERVGGDTTLSKMIALVKEAGASKAPIAKLADKVSGVFVPTVMSIAAVVFVFWLTMGKSFDFALSNGISVLVISCPCALGLATPVAVTVSVGRLAERGILVTSAEALEILHDTKCVVLDKTGTVTEGRPKVCDSAVIDGDETMLYETALTLESGSEHPLGEAIRSWAERKVQTNAKLTDFEALSGRGIRGRIDGELCIGGNAAFMRESGVIVESRVEEKIAALSAEGKTAMLFARNGKLLGIVAAADKIKSDSKSAVASLGKMGIDVVMLTGDNRKTAEAIASEVGIRTVYADVLPADKEKIIASLQQDSGSIITYVGDGINDAPALTKANVGMAIGSGADIAIDSADIVLMKSNLSDVPAVIAFSKLTIKNIRQNLFWAFFYNTLGIPIAAGVLSPFGITLSPMIGAAAMSLSSLFVVTNALRLSRKNV